MCFGSRPNGQVNPSSLLFQSGQEHLWSTTFGAALATCAIAALPSCCLCMLVPSTTIPFLLYHLIIHQHLLLYLLYTQSIIMARVDLMPWWLEAYALMHAYDIQYLCCRRCIHDIVTSYYHHHYFIYHHHITTHQVYHQCNTYWLHIIYHFATSHPPCTYDISRPVYVVMTCDVT
jgi:hypothetical protein